MLGRARKRDTTRRDSPDHDSPRPGLLTNGWKFCATSAGAYDSPKTLALALAPSSLAPNWLPTIVPTTVAASLRALKQWSLDAPARRFDALDWWFQVPLHVPAPAAASVNILGFDGLATLAEVWIDDILVLTSANMHLSHEVPLDAVSTGAHTLTLRFAALDAALAQRRPRPRWRAPMVENQQLRWYRTTLLGRTPGWSPPAQAVGAWREVWLEQRQGTDLAELSLTATLKRADASGLVHLQGRWQECLPTGAQAHLHLSGHGQHHCVRVSCTPDGRFETQLNVPNPHLWWPHTHGEPALYLASLSLDLPPAREASAAATTTWDLGAVGFREVAISTAQNRFEVLVNGVRVFCRGACWTPLDPVTLHASPDAYPTALAQVRDAGMNMLRVAGTMVYEAEHFYNNCDQLGILVWQDFMFANMDYPEQDPGFADSCAREVQQTLTRLKSHPCVALWCGNSEVSQQASMWGAPRELWNPTLFADTVRHSVAQQVPDTPYWPSSAFGGAFPHAANAGTTSYYGVGAYLRPLEDARRAAPRFATECLGFANLPEPITLERIPGGNALRSHHAAWKERTPRDLGAGWDFEDVRDHYLKLLCDVDPSRLRATDYDRYLGLSRLVPAEVMASTLQEWRAAGSSCSGALIWFWRDLWPGAGWGLIGADGCAKAPWYHLRRVLQPVSLGLTDEGGSGLAVQLVNDTARELRCCAEIQLYRNGRQLIANGQRDLLVPPRSAQTLNANEWFDTCLDLNYAYRFGPPSHDLVVARLRTAEGVVLCETAYLPQGLGSLTPRELGWSAELKAESAARPRELSRQPDQPGLPSRPGPGPVHLLGQRPAALALTLTSPCYAHGVVVNVPGYDCSDGYFPLFPGVPRHLRLTIVATATVADTMIRGEVRALNAHRYLPCHIP